MDIRSAVIQRITERFMRFRAAFDRFNDAAAEREMVGPNWNVRDLAGHLAYWTAQTARCLSETPAAPLQRDFDRINDEIFRKNRRMSFVMLLPQLRAAEENLLSVLNTIKPELLMTGTAARDLIDEGIIDHCDHHWPGLKAALERLS